MGKGKKFLGKRRKGSFKAVNKNKKKNKEHEVINKKAIFNRYKDKQKVEEEFAKKKQMEARFKQQQTTYSESESEEEDAYGQLISCFNGKKKSTIESEDDVSSSEEPINGNSDEEVTNAENKHSDNSDYGSDNESGSDGGSSDNNEMVICSYFNMNYRGW